MLYLATWIISQVLKNSVDTIIGFKGISDLFACKYYDLYNSVSNTVDDCSSMMTKLYKICSSNCSCGGKCQAQHTIPEGDLIYECNNGLHNNTRHGTYDMFSDHLIILFVHLI